MKIVEVVGGLGNQMFQYAFYLALKDHYKEDVIKLYLGRFDETVDNQGYELQHIFHINEPLATFQEVDGLVDDSLFLLSRVRRKIFGCRPSYYGEKVFKYDEGIKFLRQDRTIYLRGHRQDEVYFRHIREQVLDAFQFNTPLDRKNQDIMESIRGGCSVSLHVRRGDSVSNPKYNKISGNVCTEEYYRKAVAYLIEREADLSFYIFSDDIAWVKEQFDFLQGVNTVFVDHNHGKNSYIDMWLMSECSHNIVANSTFSWWGAWLNKSPNKLVLAPNRWFKNNARLEDNHIVPDSWVKIKT